MTCVDFTARRLPTKWRKLGYELQMQIAPGNLLSSVFLSDVEVPRQRVLRTFITL